MEPPFQSGKNQDSAWRISPSRCGLSIISLIFAPAGKLVPQALRTLAKRGHGGLRRHPYERYSQFSLRMALGGNASSAPSPISRIAMAKNFLLWLQRFPSAQSLRLFPYAKPKALERLRTGQVTGALVLIPDERDDCKTN